MQALIFFEGLLAFISPCILPMVPVYILYLAGGKKEKNTGALLLNSLGFIAGFTIIFILMGATATAVGKYVIGHRELLEKIAGAVIILFGLNYLGVFKISFLNNTYSRSADTKNLNPIKSMAFGAAFSLGWTPCLGALLGSALMMASLSNTLWQGVWLLFLFSMGLGLPFLLLSLLTDKLMGVTAFLKKHQRAINIISGVCLLAVGALMLLGLFSYWMYLFA